jgi:hypothetical protein
MRRFLEGFVASVVVGQYDASQYNPSANQTNPPLRLGDAKCLNDSVYSGVWPHYQLWQSSGGQNPLTWATVAEQDGVDAVPDPDSPAVVP